MNKKYIIPMLAIFLIGTVFAGTIISVRAIEKTIPSEEHIAIENYLVDRYDAKQSNEDLKYDLLSTEEKNDIKKIEVETSDCITFDERYCKFNAILPGILNSHDVVLNLYEINCLEYDNETMECIEEEKIYYTDSEIAEHQDAWVSSRIKEFSENLIKENSFISETIKTGSKINFETEVSIK